MSKVELVQITPDAEKMMAYIARVSSPNQENPEYAGLLRYCIKHGHWSVFEHAHITLEITTSRAIGAQILRHRSFCFQEFSQRYAEADGMGYEDSEARRQDTKNRQNSIDNMPEAVQKEWAEIQEEIWRLAMFNYNWALGTGMAKECARMILPLNTTTRIYMTGNIRSWIHYIELRSANGTQKEHMEIALEAKRIFCEQLPVVAEALGWNEE